MELANRSVQLSSSFEVCADSVWWSKRWDLSEPAQRLVVAVPIILQ